MFKSYACMHHLQYKILLIKVIKVTLPSTPSAKIKRNKVSMICIMYWLNTVKYFSLHEERLCWSVSIQNDNYLPPRHRSRKGKNKRDLLVIFSTIKIKPPCHIVMHIHIFTLIYNGKCFDFSNVDIPYLFHLNPRHLIFAFLNVLLRNIINDKIDAIHDISRVKNPLANSLADIWRTKWLSSPQEGDIHKSKKFVYAKFSTK